jgi:lysophospholipase L1-like esterase
MGMLNMDAKGDVIHNVATPGQTLYPLMIMDPSHQVDTKFLGPDYRNIAVIWAGTNDIFLDSGLDVSALHESIRDWCNGRRERGYQVIVCTITPRSDYGAPRSFEENREALNEMIRAHYLEYADGLADLASNPYIGDAGDELDTMYYYDRVHMTALGYAIAANIVMDSIIRLPDTYSN